MSQKLQSQIFSLLPNNLSRRKQINHFTVNYIDGKQAKANAWPDKQFGNLPAVRFEFPSLSSSLALMCSRIFLPSYSRLDGRSLLGSILLVEMMETLW